jgi:putative FmdB family regulatory protein
MPTYEYRCANGHTFEQFQKISDAPLDVCLECGATAERILSGGAGLLFKGSGFYITDYRSDSYRKAAESDKGGSSSSESGKGGSKSTESGSAAASGTDSGGKAAGKGGAGAAGSGGAGGSGGSASSGGSAGPASGGSGGKAAD